MTITLDASSTPAGGTGLITFSHTSAAGVRGVVCTVAQSIGATDEITSVTYGGVALTRVAALFKSSGETGAVYAYLLGVNCPTGLQTCNINVNGTGSNKRCAFWSLNAAANASLVVKNTATINSDSVADPTVSLALGGVTCWVNIVFISGQDDPTGITPLSGWTGTGEDTLGALGISGGHYRYNTISNVDVSCGWTQTAEDALAIAFAVNESFGVGKTYRINDVSSILDVT